MAASLLVEGLRRHVGAVGPGDRARVGVDRDAGEVGRVTKRLEYSAPLAPSEIDIADRSVREGQAQPVLANDLDRGNVHELLHEHHATGAARSAEAASRGVPAP